MFIIYSDIKGFFFGRYKTSIHASSIKEHFNVPLLIYGYQATSATSIKEILIKNSPLPVHDMAQDVLLA